MTMPASTVALLLFAATELLPIDAVMEAYEAAIPNLKAITAKTETEIGKVGPAEPKWETLGISAAAALIAGRGTVDQHVLGEWEKGGHGVTIEGDRPLEVPQKLNRYLVREYRGSIDYHTYHRNPGGTVIHTFGSATALGHSRCTRSQGIELISATAWREWSGETALMAFGMAQMTRDDTRTYCMIYRPVANGRFAQLAFTPEGQPYLSAHEDSQAFTVTPRTEAIARMFAE